MTRCLQSCAISRAATRPPSWRITFLLEQAKKAGLTKVSLSAAP